MNYAEIIRIKYPSYIITHTGDGSVYEDLQWSIFNQSPNPIPKATLDADIAAAIAAGIVSGSLDFTQHQADELNAISNIPDDRIGFIKKLGNNQYSVDSSTYLTQVTEANITTALGYTPYNSTNPSNYTTKTYVDNLALSGVIWLKPVHAFNFVGTASAPPTSANENENYIIENGGNTGAWSSFNVGDRVSWIGGQWVLREVTIVGCRLGVCFDRTTTPVGVAAGYQDYIGEITGGDAINGWTWQWTAPAANNAVFNNLKASTKFGQAYTYTALDSKWIAFANMSGVSDGEGLTFSNGSTLNVNVGKGLEILSDKVSVNLHPTGGIITSLDGVTPSSATNAGLALETVFSNPGQYNSVTVDVYGRITGGTNPTTLSGYGITDAVNTNLLGQPTGVATLDTNGKLSSSQIPTSLSSDWSAITNKPNSIAGYGIIDNLTYTVNGRFGNVTLSKSDVGLSNVDNTSDLNKPISTVTQTALNLKLDSSNYTAADVLSKLATVDGSTSGLDADLLDGFHAADFQASSSELTALSNLSGTGFLKRTGINTYSFDSNNYVNVNLLGDPNGVATLNALGKVNSSQLPSYVDDVEEYTNLASFPVTGETSKIYIALDSNKIYRWSGSVYVEISSAALSDATLKLNTARTISATGDAAWSVTFDGSANVTSSLTLANVVTGATATKVTFNNKGLVTGSSSLLASDIPNLDWSKITTGLPTTLSGYGITDAAPLSHVSDTALHLTSAQNTFIDAITATSTEVNYLSGVTSNVQTQLSNKEPSITSGTTSQYYRGDKSWQTLDKTAVGLSNVDNTSDLNKPISTATQTALNAKQDTITGAATTITTSNLTASRALTSDASGKVSVSTVTGTELGYVSGVTSSIQTQLNGKQASLGYTAENAANKGVANGYCPLDATSKIAATYLPSYVDDVLEYANLAAFPATGETGKIYTALDSNKIYRWSGSVYVEISASPGSTDAVPEGTTNLYFTNARAQASITGGASSIVTSNLTINRALLSDASGKVSVSAVTNTELGYLSGVTSAIQTQLSNKQPLESKLTSLSGLNNTTTGFLKYTNGVASYDTNVYVQAGLGAGTILQSKTTTVAAQSGTTLIPLNATPTTANGTQLASQILTLATTSSTVAISWSTYVDCANNNKNVVAAVFRGSVCVYAQLINVTTASRAGALALYFVDSPATTGNVTYSIRFGADSATTWYIGQTSAGTTFPGVNTSTISFVELS